MTVQNKNQHKIKVLEIYIHIKINILNCFNLVEKNLEILLRFWKLFRDGSLKVLCENQEWLWENKQLDYVDFITIVILFLSLNLYYNRWNEIHIKVVKSFMPIFIKKQLYTKFSWKKLFYAKTKSLLTSSSCDFNCIKLVFYFFILVKKITKNHPVH